MMLTDQQLAAEVRAILRDAKVTARALAEAADVPYGHLLNVVSPSYADTRRALRTDYLLRLAGALDGKSEELKRHAARLRELHEQCAEPRC